MSNKNPESVYEINPKLAWREVGGKVAVVAPMSQELVILNQTGSLLWLKIAEQSTSRSDLCDSIVQHFNLERFRAEQDVDSFLSELMEKDLINEIRPIKRI